MLLALTMLIQSVQAQPLVCAVFILHPTQEQAAALAQAKHDAGCR